jgi:5-methylcytosine-specific restriction endonuclease McrA
VCEITDESKRYVSGKCKSCYSKENWKKNHPKIMKYCSECNKQLGFKTQKDKCTNCRNRERYASDPEYREKILKRNIRNNQKESAKERKRLAVIKRRTLIFGNKFSLTKKEWEVILNTFNHRCAYCGEEGKMEMDHVIPISKGGQTTKENIVPCCRSCNSKKNNHTDWIPVVRSL